MQMRQYVVVLHKGWGMSDEQQILEEAMYAAETGNANHWPIVASILADEITRLRAQLAEVEGQEPSEPAPYGYCPICGKPGVQRERRLAGDDLCVSGHKYPSAESLTHPAPAKVPDESELVHIGYTNGAQVLYCVTDESGSFYPDTENDTCIPVYMLRTHAHRLESTTNGAVTLDRIKREWAMLKSHGGE